MDWVRQERSHNSSDGSLSDTANVDAMLEGSIELSMHISPILSVSRRWERSWSDFPFTSQGSSIPRDLCVSDQGSTEQRPRGGSHGSSRARDIARLADKEVVWRAKKSGRT